MPLTVLELAVRTVVAAALVAGVEFAYPLALAAENQYGLQRDDCYGASIGRCLVSTYLGVAEF